MSTITAGLYKGRKLVLPQHNHAVRASKSRVVQAGFNMLNSRVSWQGTHVLDVCCGSGQWGLEALSRGAEHVTFVDTDLSLLNKNIHHLAIPANKVTLLRRDVHKISLPPADVLIADPPYQSDIASHLLAQAATTRITWWLLETARQTPLNLPEHLTLLRNTHYGQSALWLLQRP